MAIKDRPIVSAFLGNEKLETDIGFVADARMAVLTGAVTGDVGHAAGYRVTGASTSIVAIEGQTYTEQSSEAERSVVATNASDTAAGTGARKVRIKYYNNLLEGPFTVELTMNGTTAVDTGVTDIRFVEEFEVTEVGSNDSNVGNVDLRDSTGGSGSNIARIPVGEGRVFFAHHYVAANRFCVVQDIIASISAGVDAEVIVRVQKSIGTDPMDVQALQRLFAKLNDVRTLPVNLTVKGPARIKLFVGPVSATATTIQAGFSYVEM